MANSTWDEEMLIDVYRLSKQGLSDTMIAKAIGVTPKTFTIWKKSKKSIRKALKSGRQSNSEISRTFQDYVFNRLPERLQKTWKKIQLCSSTNQIIRMEAILDKKGTLARQQLFIHAFISSNFNITQACRMVNIPLKTYQYWVNNDPNFGEIMMEMDNYKEDFFESALIQKILEGDTKAIIFAAKAKLKGRGYGDEKKVSVTVSGQISNTVVNVDDLGLSLETRKEMLEKVRQRQPPRIAEIEETKLLS